MRSLQDRLLRAWQGADPSDAKNAHKLLLEDKSANKLLEAIRSRLLHASDVGRLSNPHHEIRKYVGFEKRVPEGSGGTHAIAGGIKDQRRDPASARLIRDDGAWIHFTLTVREERGYIELLTYDFEIVFRVDARPGWLRFDLNAPGHENDHREIRSHFHPGNDELLAPAPVMTPIEILNLFLTEDHLRERDPEKPRA